MVNFVSYTGEIKQGKLMSLDGCKWWVQVKEPINYALPIENKGKIIGWVPQHSPTIDYYVSPEDILNIIEKDETVDKAA
jgi:hypothetical protein